MQKMPAFFSILPCRLKIRVTEIRPNPTKRNLFRPRGDILTGPRIVGYRPRRSCDGFEIRRNWGADFRILGARKGLTWQALVHIRIME